MTEKQPQIFWHTIRSRLVSLNKRAEVNVGTGSRQHWMVHVILGLTVLLTALFTAQGATQIAAARTLVIDHRSQAPVGPTDQAANGNMSHLSPRQKADAILARKVFDSAPTENKAEEEANPSDSTAPVDPNAPPPPCSGLKLVGLAASNNRPERSFAAISENAGPAKIYFIGLENEGYTLDEVLPSGVYMKRSGSRCSVGMFAREGAAAPPPPAAVAEEGFSNPTGGLSDADYKSGIQKVSEKEYNISRSFLNKVLENQSEIMRSAVVRPRREGNRVVGVRLYGIRPNSLLSHLGLQNGDTLRTINGFDMSAPDKALEAYAKLRSAERLTIAIERGGSPQSFDYNVR